MPICNHRNREILFNLAFCGPPAAGKATTLGFIFQKIDAHFRSGQMNRYSNAFGDDCLDFDVYPSEALKVGRYRVKVKLKAVSGCMGSPQSLTDILHDADGVVFVADSSPRQIDSNLECFASTRQSLESNEIDPDQISSIYQFNKRDLRDAVAPEKLDEVLSVDQPSVLTCALSGYQIMETFEQILKKMLGNFDRSILDQNDEVILSR